MVQSSEPPSVPAEEKNPEEPADHALGRSCGGFSTKIHILCDREGHRYWDYYRSLQDYRAGPSDERAASLRFEFDELFSTRTVYAALDDRIAKTAAKRDELLTVLTVPAVQLHNNASELLATVSARRRDVSLHSRSVRGARSMDIFTTLVQTAKMLGVSAYAYPRDRISRRFELPSLATSIEDAAQINRLASGY